MPFRVKICGVTNVADALGAVDAGADAVGLNFYRGSKRCIAVAEAQRIADALVGQITRVGVFVDAADSEIRHICQTASLRLIQLHGNESPEFVVKIGADIDFILARRLDERGTAAIANDLAACRCAPGVSPNAVLVDASVPGQFGGSGRTLDWHQLANHHRWSNDIPLILAGGLTPNNVAEAIQTVQPHAVDVATGVESSPGKKDHFKMRDFVSAAKAALS